MYNVDEVLLDKAAKYDIVVMNGLYYAILYYCNTYYTTTY